MFQNTELDTLITESSTLNTQSQIVAEWNLNSFDNIKKIGNYRYRPTVDNPTTDNYGVIAPTFDVNDILYAYTNATDSDIAVDGGYNENNIPQVFLSKDKQKAMLYSLEDCFYKNRPRSGINKVLFFEGKKINVFSKEMFQRPRYYFSNADDNFKYWTSYRKEIVDAQEKFAISKIKFTQTVSGDITYTTATYTTNAVHNFKELDTVSVKDMSSKLFSFLPKTYTITSVPSETTFTVSESATTYSELSGNIVGSSGQTVNVSGIELQDVVAYITRLPAEYGISSEGTMSNPISDAAPFVVYNNAVPANRVVIKMQTNIGSVDLGPFSDSNESYDDPFYGDNNKTVPDNWKVQYLDATNTWHTLQGPLGNLALNQTVIGADGYVELGYGLIVPEEYSDIFIYAGQVETVGSVPMLAPNGYAYLVQSGTDLGTFYIMVDGSWATFTPLYGWQVEPESPTRLTNYVTDMTDPSFYLNGNETIYREFQKIYGLRIIVESMNIPNCTFDLIELSPRLASDLTSKTASVSINKGSTEMAGNGLVVNNVAVSNGTLDLFDYDNAFGEYNKSSILNVKDSSNNIKYSIASKNLQIKVYDVIYNDNGMGFHVPIKTLYSDGFPDAKTKNRAISVTLRDGFAMFESMTAPEMLLSGATLSFAMASLMDSIGFTNYIFKRANDEDDPVIPYFFVRPNATVAQILQEIGVSTQTAIFFDEYNNLVFMSKKYLMPDVGEREVDYVLSGSADAQVSVDGVVKNQRIGNDIANIIEISSRDEEIYNDGKITYATRNVLKNMPTLQQANYRDSEKNWSYQNALLWEVAPEESLKPVNDDNGTGSSYTLSAIPLASSLSNLTPTVSVNTITGATLAALTRDITYQCINTLSPGDVITVTNFTDNTFNVENFRVKSATGTTITVSSRYKQSMATDLIGEIQAGQISNAISIKNNVVDFGESASWVSRYKGYFYANSEIIRYDAVEFAVSGLGLVWVTSPTEYRNFFSKMSFGGNIYATGRVRIYSEPKYINGVIQSGDVAKHGRGQFGTNVVAHEAGLSPYWSSKDNKGACKMESSYLFNVATSIPVTATTGAAGVVGQKYHPITSGVIKNMLARKEVSEKELQTGTLIDGTIQSSALVLTGPSFEASEKAIDYVSYVTKSLDNRYNHFGTRLRIIGTPAISSGSSQNPIGNITYTTTSATSTGSKQSIAGSSGGIAFMHDKNTNIGYYFELVALTENSVLAYDKQDAAKIYNVFFYKIQRGVHDETDNYPTGTDAFPIPLWAGQTPVNVDDGQFAGQYRKSGEDLPSVYDMSVEYTEQSDGSLHFYLFINNKVIAEVTDTSPIKNGANAMSVFVRGKAKVMFENVYALSLKDTSDSTQVLDSPVQSIFNYDQERANDALFKYGISGMIRDTYLSGLSVSGNTKYNLYFEEFGTIMREVAYMNVKYDKAYPALYAKMMPTFSSYQNYTISGFIASPYGAKFLVFNTSDTAIAFNLDAGTAYLRIGGISFTSQSNHQLTVDDYFSKHADLSALEVSDSGGLLNVKASTDYASIKQSRILYGKKEFNLNATYLQNQASAEEMMGWLISKMMKPRKLMGVKIFSNPMLQLGDIVTIDYTDKNTNNVVAKPDERFVIYHIQYERKGDGPDMMIFLSEVV